VITIYHSGGLTKNDGLTDDSETGFLVGQLHGPLHTLYTGPPRHISLGSPLYHSEVNRTQSE